MEKFEVEGNTPEETTKISTNEEASQEDTKDNDAASAETGALTQESSMTDYLRDYDQKDRKPGSMLKATVVKISDDEIFVDIGAKTEGVLKVDELKDDNSGIDIKIGDDIDVVLVRMVNKDGFSIVSKKEADKFKLWSEIEKTYDSHGFVEGEITKRVKGGFYVNIGITAFLPGSQIDVRVPHNYDRYVGNTYKYNIMSINKDRSNIVLSRKLFIEKENEERKAKLIESIKEDMITEGTIESIMPYGLFVDIGGIEGLVHVSNLAWGRIVDPQKLYKIGDKINVKVIRFDEENQKIYLGIKQLTKDPWENVPDSFVEGSVVEGTVKNIVSYGVFIELKDGLEGLVHLSEISWDKFAKASKILKPGDSVKAKILSVNPERHRIALSIKQIADDPWTEISSRYNKGDIVIGNVTSSYDFGIFLKLEDGVEGLIHRGDISWYKRDPNPKQIYKLNDMVTAMVISVDEERRRIALSTKLLEDDPWNKVNDILSVDDEMDCSVVNVKDFGAFIDITPGIEGLVHISELDNLPADEKKLIKKGVKVKVKVLRIDKDRHRVGLALLDIYKQAEEEQTDKSDAAKLESETSEEQTDKSDAAKLESETGVLQKEQLSRTNNDESEDSENSR